MRWHRENEATRSFLAGRDLAELLARTARINRAYEPNIELSFSSMLVAFLASQSPWCVWLRRYVKNAEVAEQAILRARNLADPAKFDAIAAATLRDEELATDWFASISANKLLSTAEGFAAELATRGEPGPVDVRHLLATYIYDPAGHEEDLKKLRFHRPAWSSAFLGEMARRNSAEIDFWKRLHARKFPDEPVDLLDVDGPSAHIATDLWTVRDTLGFRAYAHAITRFMTHPQTVPPLTIGIQAPWGGGKTSLMRMIQRSIDPEAVRREMDEAKQPRGELTVAQALAEINEWIRLKTKKQLPVTPSSEQRKRLTVWFNAWKYESTNQVWAGLADAIMHQVAARLSHLEREKFWLLVNLKRVDADRLRARIYERILQYWWRGARIVVVGTLGVMAACALAPLLFPEALARWASWGLLGSPIAGSLIAAYKYWKAQLTVKAEPAAVSLGDYLEVPDYGAELGFLHHVEADLRRVLDSVPERYWPIVIFVDDLDRCTPTKVAQAVEAVNLFLAGDLPKCMFVLGLDAEMVAAALQAAHSSLTECLPEDAAVPLGWRFMDKFIQLPFLIPPAGPTMVERYADSLLSGPVSSGVTDAEEDDADRIAREAAARIMDRGSIPEEAGRVARQRGLDARQGALVAEHIEAQYVRRELDQGIETFTDENPTVRKLVRSAAAAFSRNPRDMKRFVNSFRFHYFLWWAHRAQTGHQGPSLEQLQRWVVFSMRWPEVVRWLWRPGGREWRAPADSIAATAPNRLRLLEGIAARSRDLASWHALVRTVLVLEASKTNWLNDDDLLEFLHQEGGRPEGQRLSQAVGLGLW